MVHIKKLNIFITFIVMFLFVPEMLSAREARLTNIIITNTHDNLLLYLDVDGAFREKMEKAILSGVPATFSFYITLNKVRGLWIDRKIVDITVDHTIKYNNLKNEFTVRRSWDKGKPVVTKSFKEARILMSKVESFPIVQLSQLEKGNQYQIRTKAKLSKLTLPMYLHYVLFFLSLWDFETDWYSIDFTY